MECYIRRRTWLPSLAETSAMLFLRAWCWVRAARVAPPATPTTACSDVIIIIISAPITDNRTWVHYKVSAYELKYSIMLLRHRVWKWRTLLTPAMQTMSRKYCWNTGAIISRNIATSFRTSANSLTTSHHHMTSSVTTTTRHQLRWHDCKMSSLAVSWLQHVTSCGDMTTKCHH